MRLYKRINRPPFFGTTCSWCKADLSNASGFWLHPSKNARKREVCDACYETRSQSIEGEIKAWIHHLAA